MLVSANGFADTIDVDEDLDRGNPSLAVDLAHHPQRNDSLDGGGEGGLGPVLLTGREHLGDLLQGVDHVRREQRGEHEVAGACGAYGLLDRFAVTQLADVDDVGVLAERVAQSGRERRCVEADLALADQRHLVRVDDLDGIFEGGDVETAGGIDVVEHRRKRGGLS